MTVMKYYIDGSGNYLGGWENGHPNTPVGATEIEAPPEDARQKRVGGSWTEIPDYEAPPNSDFFFNSGEITIISGGYTSLEHGLRRAPDVVQITLKCTADNAGYNAGDEINVGFMDGMSEQGASGKDSGVIVITDKDHISFQFGAHPNVFRVLQKNNGSTSVLNNSKWKMIIKAYLL